MITELRESASIAIANSSINIWMNTPFDFLRMLSIDERGRWGEDFFQRLVKKYTKLFVEWYGDKNVSMSDGVYDVKVHTYRVEVKTATKATKSNSWQHDMIHNDLNWDKLTFIDVCPHGVYFTVINYFDMVFGKEHPLFKKKSTPCKGGWKFDSSLPFLKRGIESGLTFYYNVDRIDNDGFSSFLNHHFNGSIV